MPCHPKSDRRLAITSSNRGIPVGHGTRSRRFIWPVLPMGVRGGCHVDTPRTKRQYVWEKTGGFCWYCGARLYLREDADDELKKRLVFTVDHLHPRVHGAAVVRIKCRRVSTVTRTRAGGASNNFGNGFGSGYLARRKTPFLRPGRSMRKV